MNQLEKKCLKQAERFLEYCKTNRRLTRDSVRGYSHDIKIFNKFLMGKEPPVTDYNGVDKSVLDEYVVYLQDYAVKTIKRRFAGIQSLFNYLEYMELVSENPFHKFKLRLREPIKLRVSLTKEEISVLLRVVYDSKPYEHIYSLDDVKTNSYDFLWIRNVAIFELLFVGGMRVSELCSIKFEDVDLENMYILIHGKGNRERLVFLENEEVERALVNYLKVRKNVKVYSPYIFITKNLEQLTTASVRSMVRRYAKECNIDKNVTPHVFRHTFATLLLEEGVDIKYIQDFLGHSSISTTQLYLHTNNKHKREIIAAKHPRGLINMKPNMK